MSRYLKNIALAVTTIPQSMGIAFKNMIRKPITLQYPDEKWNPPPRTRMQLHCVIDDCIGCDQCARACPVDCIKIETVKAPAGQDFGTTTTGHKKRLDVLIFDIDMAKCCYCDLCTFPCPTECLKMTKSYEDSVYDRYDLIYHYAAYLPEEADKRRAEALKMEEEEKAKKAAAAAAAAKAKEAAAAAAGAAGPAAPAAGTAAPTGGTAAPAAGPTPPAPTPAARPTPPAPAPPVPPKPAEGEGS